MVDRISEDEIRERFDMAMFLGACHRGFALYGTGELSNPERREWVEEKDGSFHLVMEAEWTDRYRARKTIDELSDVTTGQLGERRAAITLTDLQAEENELEMGAELVTDMRTGAAAALGLQYLRPAHLRRLAIVGTGRVALQAALACDELHDLECIVVTSRNLENRERFAAQASSAKARIELAPDIERCVADSDAIVAAVPTPKPVLAKAHVEGRMLVAIGGDSRTRQLAPEILRDLVILPDHLQQTLKAGEFRHAREEGEPESIRFARHEQGAVLNMGDAACERLGKVRPQVVYLTGLAALDLCAAVMIYEGLRRGRNI
jgi:ornithine cyclodeaminase/alanine dehydrogenase-like protein (mu-crystallin family)